MRPGSIPSRPYLSRGTHLVSRDLRSHMIPVMSPRTRTSCTTIMLGMAPWAILRETLASPHPTHLHHHPSSLRGAAPPSPSPDPEDLVLSLTERFDAFWDETQEHRVLVTKDMEALRADMRTVLANQATILQQQQTLQAQLAQLLSFHQPLPPPPQ